MTTKAQLIQTLKLEPHPLEGGYFQRTYESHISLDESSAVNTTTTRKLLTCIYYCLTDDSPIGYMHRNKSDIVHFYQGGGAMKYLIVSPQGQLSIKILGPDILSGHCMQLVVKGGDWKMSTLLEGDYGLLGESVAPGFEYTDNTLATNELIEGLFPDLMATIGQYIKR